MMGEREPQKSSAAGEEQRPSPRKKAGMFTTKNIIILVVGAVIASGLAILTVGSYIAPRIEQGSLNGRTQTNEASGAAHLENLEFFKLDPLIVNPAGSDGERYLKATVTLEMYNAEIRQEVEKRLPQIKSQVNNVLASKTVDQVQDVEYREKLAREILNRVNGILVSGRISNVYFEEFVIQ